MSKKFPSLIRLPRHKHFEITPRYYDPIKEEIAERTARIERELSGKNTEGYNPGRLTFDRKTSSVPNASLMQLSIAAGLGALVVGWLYYGDKILYIGWLAVPVYLYYRFKKLRKSNP